MDESKPGSGDEDAMTARRQFESLPDLLRGFFRIIVPKLIYWVTRVLIPSILYPQRLFQSGVFAPQTWVVALSLTWLGYAWFNRWASKEVEAAFATSVVEEFRDTTSAAEAADRAVERGWADRKLHGWLREVLRPPGNHFPACEQVVELFAAPGPQAPTPEERRQLLHRMVTGDRQPVGVANLLPPDVIPAWARDGLPLSIHAPVGADVYYAQAALGRGIWLKSIEVAGPTLAEDKKQFVRHYVDSFIEVVKPSLRGMQRLNGGIQWLTILWTCILVVSGMRRGLMVIVLAGSALRAGAEVRENGRCDPERIRPSSSEVAELVRRLNDSGPAGLRPAQAAEELRQKAAAADSGVYGLYINLLAAIPALGFIGTVYGIGEALLHADGLFSAADKAQALGRITEQLGFAFDTTLVALVCSTVAATSLALVRLAEQRVLDNWVAVLGTIKDGKA